MLDKSQERPKPRRQHIIYLVVPTRKRQDGTNDVQIEIEKREGREEKIRISTSRTQERRQHAMGICILQARKERGEGCSTKMK